ncbi:MAG: diguanylate cyclase [Candidatus Thiodiazotropha sp.]
MDEDNRDSYSVDIPESMPDRRFSARREMVVSFLWLFLPVSLLLAGIFFAFSNQTEKYELQTTLIREESAMHSASELTSLVFVQKLSDLFVLAEGEILKTYLHDRSLANWIRVAREFSLFARRKPKYQQLRLINLQGKEEIRVNNQPEGQEIVPRNALQDKSGRYYFEESVKLEQGEIYVSPLDLNVENGMVEQPIRPTIRFATPVVDGYGVKQGVLVINYTPDEYLARIEEIFKDRQGQSVMLNSEGYWLLGVPEEQRWGFMYGREDTFAKRWPKVWAAIDSTDKGSFISDDGVFVFQKSFPVNLARQGTLENLEADESLVPGESSRLYWIFLSHISRDTIKELTAKRSLIGFVTYLLLFIVTAVISLFFARNSVQKKQAYLRLQQFATTDPLTGLANRREFEAVARREFLRAQRFQRDFSFMMLDLDHFKRINDTYGHGIGDEVLKHVVDICDEAIRSQDFLARYGGEEFVVLLPETDLAGAYQLGVRVCQWVADRPFVSEDIRITTTVSIGVSSIHVTDEQVTDILRRADNALYEAKRSGRNCVVISDPCDKWIEEDLIGKTRS